VQARLGVGAGRQCPPATSSRISARSPATTSTTWRSAPQGATDLRTAAAAGDLLRAHLSAAGVGAGSRVGVALEPSPDFPAAVLALMALGAVYVPIERR